MALRTSWTCSLCSAYYCTLFSLMGHIRGAHTNVTYLNCAVSGCTDKFHNTFQGMSQLNDGDISDRLEGVLGLSSPLDNLRTAYRRKVAAKEAFPTVVGECAAEKVSMHTCTFTNQFATYQLNIILYDAI